MGPALKSPTILPTLMGPALKSPTILPTLMGPALKRRPGSGGPRGVGLEEILTLSTHHKVSEQCHEEEADCEVVSKEDEEPVEAVEAKLGGGGVGCVKGCWVGGEGRWDGGHSVNAGRRMGEREHIGTLCSELCPLQLQLSRNRLLTQSVAPSAHLKHACCASMQAETYTYVGPFKCCSPTPLPSV
jgi:hypothetical protein